MALYLARVLVENRVFPGVRELEFPTLEETREALGIHDFVAYKVEYDFTEQSYLKQLSELNPSIKATLARIQENAVQEAQKIRKELFKEQHKEIVEKE